MNYVNFHGNNFTNGELEWDPLSNAPGKIGVAMLLVISFQ